MQTMPMCLRIFLQKEYKMKQEKAHLCIRNENIVDLVCLTRTDRKRQSFLLTWCAMRVFCRQLATSIFYSHASVEYSPSILVKQDIPTNLIGDLLTNPSEFTTAQHHGRSVVVSCTRKGRLVDLQTTANRPIQSKQSRQIALLPENMRLPKGLFSPCLPALPGA